MSWEIPSLGESDRSRLKRQIGLRELIGWRLWYHTRSSLTSFVMDYTWIPGINESRPPKPDNQEGFYSLKTPQLVIEKYSTISRCFILGAIEMWGEVIEGEIGYRAQFAEIRNIVCLVYKGPKFLNDCPILDNLRETYLK